MAVSVNTKKGIPAIPLAALAGVKDENVRQVLQAISDGLQVRNGNAGSGEQRFVTAVEVGEIRSTIQAQGQRFSLLEQQSQTSRLTASDINRIINDLQAQVMESLLWKELGERIDLIDINLILTELNVSGVQTGLSTEITNRINGDDAIVSSVTTQFAAANGNIAALQTTTTTLANDAAALSSTVTTQFATVNGNIAALQTTTDTLTNSVAAVSSTVTTLQASVASNTAAIQTEATVRANADGDIYAKYSVKIDVNGYVSGFGLISTANNSTPFSEFIVRADRFAIGSPSGPGITPAIPFIVTTTPTARPDGTTLPPGVYMSTAVVKEIFGAYIFAGLLEAASVYTGSRFIDKDSKFPVLSAAAASYYNPVSYTGTTINWSANLTMYGPDFHSTVPINQRVSIQPAGSPGVTFLVTATATIDHFFSLYYSTNGGTTWTRIATTVEPQSGYGSVTITGVVQLSIAAASTVDFGVSVLNASGTPWSATHIWIQELSMSVLAVNV